MQRLAAPAFASIFILMLNGCAAFSTLKEPPQSEAPRTAWRLEGHAMIVAADARAAGAGLDILKKGGSAVDAAIAAEAVLGLVEPQSSGLGGGGFLLSYRRSSSALDLYDGRETAPAKANPSLFLDAAGKPLSFPDAWQSGLSTGAPGLIPMLKLAHDERGALPWADLFAPAIQMAEHGFAVSPRLHDLLLAAKKGRLDDTEPAKSYFYDAAGAPRPVGFMLKNLDYARTLRAIAAQGPDALTRGPIAERIVKTVQNDKRPGRLSLQDLRDYRAKKRAPACLEYRRYKVCSTPPPGGGISVLSALGALRAHPEIGARPGSADSWGLFIDASRLAYADRDYYVADPDAVSVPSESLLDRRYLDARGDALRAGEKLREAQPGDPSIFSGGPSLLGHWAGDATTEIPGTTHVSVVDARGDAVAMTATVEAPFGSQNMTDGFLLNNQLTDFTSAPSPDGRPFANAPGPSKRPRSSMAPTIILDPEGDFYAATGSPGGSSIIAYTLKTIVAMIDWGATPQEAVALPNIVARSGAVRMEIARTPKDVVEALRARGYKIQDSTGEASGLHIVRAGVNGFEGGADPRREGLAAGF